MVPYFQCRRQYGWRTVKQRLSRLDNIWKYDHFLLCSLNIHYMLPLVFINVCLVVQNNYYCYNSFVPVVILLKVKALSLYLVSSPVIRYSHYFTTKAHTWYLSKRNWILKLNCSQRDIICLFFGKNCVYCKIRHFS